MNAWEPRLNNRGEVLSGRGAVWFSTREPDGAWVHIPLLDPGWNPTWIDDDVFVYNPGGERAFALYNYRERRLIAERAPGFNSFAGGGGRWAGQRSDELYLFAGVSVISAHANTGPADVSDDGRVALLTPWHGDLKALYLDGEKIAEGPIMRVSVCRAGLAWTIATGTYTRAVIAKRHDGTAAVDVSVLNWEWASAVDGPDGTFWILSETQRGLLLRPFTDPARGYYRPGVFHAPHCKYLADTFLIVASGDRGEFEHLALSPNVPRGDLTVHRATDGVELEPTPEPRPLPDPIPVPEDPMPRMMLPSDVHATFVSVVRKYPHTGDEHDRRAAMRKAIETLRAKHGTRWVWKTEHTTGYDSASKDALAFVPASEGDVKHGERQRMFIWDMIDGTSREPNPPHQSEELRPAYTLAPEPKDWLAGDVEDPEDDEPEQPAGCTCQAELAALEQRLRALITAADDTAVRAEAVANEAKLLASKKPESAYPTRIRLKGSTTPSGSSLFRHAHGVDSIFTVEDVD